MMFISESLVKARYAETDQMGVVHHAVYPVWFEVGRTEYLAGLGIPYSAVEARGFFLPLIELSCSFKSIARYEDEILIKTRAAEVSKVKVILHYEAIKKPDGTLIAMGSTVHAWTNNQMKPVNIQKGWPEIYDLLCKAVTVEEVRN